MATVIELVDSEQFLVSFSDSKIEFIRKLAERNHVEKSEIVRLLILTGLLKETTDWLTLRN